MPRTDADGHETAINSSRFGSQNRAYDADGYLVSDAEPTAGGYQSPATLTYAYYPDGKKKSLSISSSLVSASNEFQYSYRADGQLQRQQLTWPMSGAFSWTYTAAGRELTQSDPYTGVVVPLYTQNGADSGQTRTMQAKTYSYDAYGRVASLVLPQGYTIGSVGYDSEDEMTGYARTNANCASSSTVYSCAGGTLSETYGNRGELVLDSDTGRTLGQRVQNQSAAGVIAKDTFDVRSGEVLQDKVGYSYDSAGRQTVIQSGPPPSGYTGSVSPITRSYDAENHLISQTVSGGTYWCAYTMQLGCDSSGGFSAPYNASYGWGPNGHPITLTGNYTNTGATTLSVHWDGDDVLFVPAPNAYGSAQFSVGSLAVANVAGGLTVVDRNLSGTQVATHGVGGFGQWLSAPAAKPTNTKLPTLRGVAASDPVNYPDMGATEYLSHGRTDGYSDLYGNTFQGVRVSDQNTGSWMSPDAYAGDVHDPMSQKPFMWNRNNSVAYSDPSGYVATVVVNGNNVTISVPLTFDKRSTHAERERIKNGIEKQWSGNFGQYHVRTVTTSPGPGKATNVVSTSLPAGARSNVIDNKVNMNMHDRDSSWVAGHEAGHLMGLSDKYKETVGAGGRVTDVPLPGYSDNVMGARDKTGVKPNQITQIIRSNSRH